MNKTFKRILSLALAGAMALSLAACAPKDNAPTGGDQASSDGKLFTADTQLDLLIGSHVSWSYNENWKIWEYFKEATGATYNITAIPGAEFATKLPLIMSTPKELPDLMYLTQKNFVDDYATSGAYVSLDDNIDLMPNYKAFLDSLDESARKDLLNLRRSGDGKVYSAPCYGTHRVTNIRTWLYRKDVFEKNNIAVPTTYEELYQAAKKLKELYPESYPICFREGLSNINNIAPAWKEYMSSMPYYDYINEEWRMGVRDPEYKQLVEFFLKLANEGLVAPNYTTIETKGWEELMSTDRGFITVDYVVRVDFFNSANRQQNPDYTLAFMAPPVPDIPGGSAKLNKTNLDFSGYVVLNTGDKESIDNSFKLVDWMYTDEAVELLSWGKEGETYTVDENGKKSFIVEPGEEVISKYGVASSGLYQIIDQDAFETSYTEENIATCIESLKYLEPYSNPTLWLALTEDEADKKAALQGDIKAYVEEELSKFLLGQKPMSEWDSFLAGLDEMGADELLNIYSTAYDRIK